MVLVTHGSLVNLFQALNLLGVPTTPDCNDGNASGAAFSPTDIDPVNQTRSDARRTYYDPIVNRPNFHVITGQFVTRVLVQGLDGVQSADVPTTGGSPDGEGTAGADTGGLNFGPAGSNLRYSRKDTNSANVNIIGVEVRSLPNENPEADDLVCFQCIRATTDRHGYSRGNRCNWGNSFDSVDATLWIRTGCTLAAV